MLFAIMIIAFYYGVNIKISLFCNILLQEINTIKLIN